MMAAVCEKRTRFRPRDARAGRRRGVVVPLWVKVLLFIAISIAVLVLFPPKAH